MSTYDHTREGLALYAKGQRFEAHESFEAAWKNESGSRRITLQALVQICAAAHKAAQDTFRGTVRLLGKAQARLAEVSPEGACLGLDLVELKNEVDRALGEAQRKLDAPSTLFTPPRLPETTHEAGIVYLHGFASSPQSAKARAIVPALEQAGWPVTVPDLNENDFTHLTITRALARTRRGLKDRSLIVGSSLGGYIAALLAAQDPRIKALVLMAPAFDFANRLESIHGTALSEWKAEGTVAVEHYGYGETRPIAYRLYEDAQTHPARPSIDVPTYILQGAHDDVVPADMVQAVAAENRTSVEINVVDDDHSLIRHADDAKEAALRLAARWLTA